VDCVVVIASKPSRYQRRGKVTLRQRGRLGQDIETEFFVAQFSAVIDPLLVSELL